MKLSHLKNLVGFGLVGLHIVSIILCYIWIEEKMSPQSFRITLLLIAPVSAVYAMAFVKDAIRHMYDKTGNSGEVSMTFSVLAVLFSLFFGGLVIYNLYLFRIGTTQNPEDLKDRLAMIEVAAGGFLGLIFETLFSDFRRAGKPESANLSADKTPS